MQENYFLYPLLSVNPIFVFLLVLLANFLSLLPVAIKTKRLKMILLKNPAFFVGDFILLPSIASLIAFFYQDNIKTSPLTSSQEWSMLILLLSLAITFMAAIKFKLIKILWLPHGLFYFSFIYILITFLTNSVYYLINGKGSSVDLIILITVILLGYVHQYLGYLYPKKFPY